jgi:tRNA U34 5-carboxymethylaminomethyl modifying enzyme MnmG/GidA
MERIPQATQIHEKPESSESVEGSIERANELWAELQKYNETDIVGRAAFQKVEELAHALSMQLKDIPPSVCLREGLPWHPQDSVIAANNEQYAVAS